MNKKIKMALEKTTYKEQVTVFTRGSDLSDIYLACLKPSGSPLGFSSSFAGYQVVSRFAMLCWQILHAHFDRLRQASSGVPALSDGSVEGSRARGGTGVYPEGVAEASVSPACKMSALSKRRRLIILLMLLRRNSWIISNILIFVAWRVVWKIPVFTMQNKGKWFSYSFCFFPFSPAKSF